MAAYLELRRTVSDPIPSGALEQFEFAGLAGVLEKGDYRAHRSRPTGAAAAYGYAWRLADQWSGTWWPQGIAVGDYDGVPLALVSWYAQPRRRGAMGARISVVDLRNDRFPRYHHVLLVTPRQTETSVVFDPVPVHAGGIAWSGDRLLVAATFKGILEFQLSDILSAKSRGPLRGSARPFGYRYVLPVFARYEPVAQTSDRMRYSFLTVSKPDAVGSAAELPLLAGEYGHEPGLRLAEVTLTDAGSMVSATHVSPVPQMQGVAKAGEHWYVSSSHGDTHGGHLWSGPIDELQKHDGVLPPGPQSLCIWPERNEIWSLSETPGRRWMFAIDPSRW